MEDLDFVRFKTNIFKKTGIDLNQYKEAQMKRRLTSLRDKRGFSSFSAYYEALIKDHALFAEFLDRMTINVSEFFRNPNRWEVLEKKILPELLSQSSHLKVWSAACSTGEEPYSLVMLLSRYLPLSQIVVEATDIDENALAKAKEGRYLERSLEHVPKDLVHKYFVRRDMLYEVSDQIKRCVRFRKQNLLSDPFGQNYDLIVCRNVLIYFTEEAKEGLYHKFSNALKTGGILFVGSTEQIFQSARYRLKSEQTFFYQRF